MGDGLLYRVFSDEVAIRKWNPGPMPRKPRTTSEILGMMAEEFGIGLDELTALYRKYAVQARDEHDTSWLPAIDDVGIPEPEEEIPDPRPKIRMDSFLPRTKSQRPDYSAKTRKRSSSSSSPMGVNGLGLRRGEMAGRTIKAPEDLRTAYRFLLEKSNKQERGSVVSNPYRLLCEQFGKESGHQLLIGLGESGYRLLRIERGMMGVLVPEEQVEFDPSIPFQTSPGNADRDLHKIPGIGELEEGRGAEGNRKPESRIEIRRSVPDKAATEDQKPKEQVEPGRKEERSMTTTKILLTLMEMDGFRVLWDKARLLEDGSGAVAGPTTILQSSGLTRSQAGNVWIRLITRRSAKALPRSESKAMASKLGLALPSRSSIIGILAPKEQAEVKPPRPGRTRKPRPTSPAKPKPRKSQARAKAKPEPKPVPKTTKGEKNEIEQIKQGLRALIALFIGTNQGTIQTALALLDLKGLDLLPPDIEAVLLEKPRP